MYLSTKMVEKRDSQDTNKKANILDLFRTPNLRLTTLCLYFNWLVCGFCFYGLAQYMGHLGGDIFVNIAVSGLIEMPGCVVCIYFMGRFGRRNTMISSQMLAAAACLLIAVVPQGETRLRVSSSGILSASQRFSVTTRNDPTDPDNWAWPTGRQDNWVPKLIPLCPGAQFAHAQLAAPGLRRPDGGTQLS
uniref:(California timema) hypothetical protein n=1 Tax=Timema californicum TaxID=61474 RepID=A0A7R9J3E1_TIMCA|nr:unnamed protein product [Timema californicum]